MVIIDGLYLVDFVPGLEALKQDAQHVHVAVGTGQVQGRVTVLAERGEKSLNKHINKTRDPH